MRKHGSILAIYIIHTEAVMTLGLKLQRHQPKMAWLVGNALGHVARSPLGIGLLFNADLSELLSALSSPWGLTLSSGCLSLWYQSNCNSFNLICSFSIQKKRQRGGRHFCWLALQSEEILSLSPGRSLLSELNWTMCLSPWTSLAKRVTTPFIF